MTPTATNNGYCTNGSGSTTTAADKAEARIIAVVRKLLKEAKSRNFTGKGIIELGFNQGGVAGFKAGLVTWVNVED